MSTTLLTIDKSEKDGGTLTVTRFFGGVKRKVCFQLTQDTGYVQLTKKDLKEIVKVYEKEAK